MKRPMSDAEYVAGAGASCPFCGSGELEVVENLQADGCDCWQEVECQDCGKTWRDVYRLAGYEGTDEAGNYREVEGKPKNLPDVQSMEVGSPTQWRRSCSSATALRKDTEHRSATTRLL